MTVPLSISRAIVCDAFGISVMCDDTRENPGLLKRFHNEQDIFTNLYWCDVNLSGKSLLIVFDFENTKTFCDNFATSAIDSDTLICISLSDVKCSSSK